MIRLIKGFPEKISLTLEPSLGHLRIGWKCKSMWHTSQYFFCCMNPSRPEDLTIGQSLISQHITSGDCNVSARVPAVRLRQQWRDERIKNISSLSQIHFCD